MFIDFSSRTNERERMEDPSLPADKLRRTLRDLAALNDTIGGLKPTVDGIEQLAEDRQSLSVLDVGCGFGDVARRIADWGQARGVDVRVTGIDLSETTVEYARRKSTEYSNLEFRTCDLFELCGEEQFDVVHAALMLHHLPDDQIVSGLKKMYDACQIGVVVNDLHRHPLAYWGSHLLLRLLSDNPIICHDGSLSILRAFTGEELRDYCRDAGLSEFSLRWWPLFRWQLVVSRKSVGNGRHDPR